MIVFMSSILQSQVLAQCENYEDQRLSDKIANYVITADLDRATHTAQCHQVVTWRNTSPEPITELRMYMYMNAFKNRKSTYLRGVDNVFGADLNDWTEDEYGHITIRNMSSLSQGKSVGEMKYIQPNDGNKNDETVLHVALREALQPGAVIQLEMDFEVKLPKTILRAGYGKNDFHLFVHWFPQMGVYEQDKQGKWDWNCHQFIQKTEFYADFGDYEVRITTDDDFVVGGSGCRVEELIAGGKKTTTFRAFDIIDFGWSAYPLFQTYTDTHQGIDIELLIPSEHCAMAPRYIKTLKQAMTFLHEHVGPYYYPKITIVDPPIHSLRSGFMEYPMMITVASVYGTPKSFRGSESLIVHEFAHMYFMGMLASNEKEEAWLDEGFVTFYEDEIMDYYYGKEGSFFDIWGIRTGNTQKSRQEYTTLPDPTYEVIAKPGWENKGYYKQLTYGKTATVLSTFRNMIGSAAFGGLIKYYFDKHKFTHPREADWLAAVDTVMSQLDYVSPSFDHQQFWFDALHTAKVVDFEVVSIDQEEQLITVRNNGQFAIRTQVLVKYADGSTTLHLFDGEREHTFEAAQHAKVVSVRIDPEQKILLDINYINNSMSISPDKSATKKYGGLAATVAGVLLNILTFF